MIFNNYINKIKELEKENIFPEVLTLTDYIEINYNYIQNRISNLNFSDKGTHKVLLGGQRFE